MATGISINSASQQDDFEVVGGTKGHLVENLSVGPLLSLFRYYPWKPIPKCTGRYTCRDHSVSELMVQELLTRARVDVKWKVREFALPDRSDAILILPLNDAKTEGVITYVKKTDANTSRYVHTLNTESGFQRKLEAVGIRMVDNEFVFIGDDK